MATDLHSDSLVDAIRSHAEAIRQRIDTAAHAAGRDPGCVHLVAVTKFFPPEMAVAACMAGLTDLGENRVQELLAKQAVLAGLGLTPNWHLIGTLQKNKVRHVIGRTSLIHSGDSIELLMEISRRSAAAGCVSRVLLQINPACEETKHGFLPAEFTAAAKAAVRLPSLIVDGIMAMAPQMPDPTDTLPIFKLSQSLFQELCEVSRLLCPDLPLPDVLSMGMSEDFPQAIACGATHIRIGTALFGPRPPVM